MENEILDSQLCEDQILTAWLQDWPNWYEKKELM